MPNISATDKAEPMVNKDAKIFLLQAKITAALHPAMRNADFTSEILK